jgi:hypothetical protein
VQVAGYELFVVIEKEMGQWRTVWGITAPLAPLARHFFNCMKKLKK